MEVLSAALKIPFLGNGLTVRQKSDGSNIESYNPNAAGAIAWAPLTLVNNWTVATGFEAPQYRIVTGNRVALKGGVSRTMSLLVNGLIATLPVGARPLGPRSFVLAAAGSAIVNVTVRANGEIVYTGSNTLANGVTNVSLEIVFDSEQ